MLERFNFYDIYAYLLPGLTVLGLAWLPYFVLGGTLPKAGLAEGFVVVVVAYAAGHVLQTFAKELWSSKVSWTGTKREYPTRALLEDQDNVLSAEMKARLKEHIAKHFKIDFAQQGAHEDAWRLCRTALKSRKGASYVEQFHGMYNFLKGAATAFAYATPYYAGWAASANWNPDQYVPDAPFWWATGCVALILIILALVKEIRASTWRTMFLCTIFVALVVATHLQRTITNAWQVALLVATAVLLIQKTRSFIRLLKHSTPNSLAKAAYERHITPACLVVATLAGGVLLGQQSADKFGSILLLVAGISWIAAVQCASTYQFFAKEFAAAIYRDYWAVVGCAEPEKKPGPDPDHTEAAALD